MAPRAQRPGVLETDLAYIQDHTGLDLLTPLGGVQDAHAEVRLITRARCLALRRRPPPPPADVRAARCPGRGRA